MIGCCCQIQRNHEQAEGSFSAEKHTVHVSSMIRMDHVFISLHVFFFYFLRISCLSVFNLIKIRMPESTLRIHLLCIKTEVFIMFYV